MLLVFRSMLPPSHGQNKALQLAAWLLFFSHANAFRSSCTRLAVCMEHTSCNTHSVHRNTHTNTHTEHILFCSPSSQSAEQLQTQNALFPSYSSLFLSAIPSHHLSSCLALSSSPSFLHLPCLSAEQQREAAFNAHALGPFLLLRKSGGRERAQIIT